MNQRDEPEKPAHIRMISHPIDCVSRVALGPPFPMQALSEVSTDAPATPEAELQEARSDRSNLWTLVKAGLPL